MSRLADKTILITGAASGIGRATALCCAREGAAVIAVDIDPKGIAGCIAELEAIGCSARGYDLDVTHDDQIKAMFAKIPHIDSVIHAAGILEGALDPIESFEEVTWDRVLDINLKGSFLISKHAVPLLESSGNGVLILVSSGAGVKGGSSSIAYGSSKGGVHGLSLVLASQLADRNIRVHAICPGALATPLKLRTVQKQADARGQDLDTLTARLGDPEGVGKIMAFLVSDDADYLRGDIFTR